jgi:hypothetical protein
VYRPGQWVPPHRETWLRVLTPARWYLYLWVPHSAWYLQSSGTVDSPYDEPDYRVLVEELRVKKRAPLVSGASAIVPALPSKSLILGKLPTVREWLTCTVYEDGTPRVPSYITLRNRGSSFEVTLYDPDQGARLPVGGPEIDHVLLALEQLLCVDEQPWEIDQYLAKQLQRGGKRRKK